MKTSLTPKEKLFQTAARLFYRDGYRATGVDAIAAESGIGKMTLYRHFPSKDDLILAFLQDSDRLFWLYFNESVQDAPTPRDKLIAFFEALQGYTTSPNCYGCPFINVAVEFPDPDYPGHRVAREHKQAVRLRFSQLARAAGARDPEGLAAALHLLMDGAYMAARMYGGAHGNPVLGSPAEGVAAAARRVIGGFIRD